MQVNCSSEELAINFAELAYINSSIPRPPLALRPSGQGQSSYLSFAFSGLSSSITFNSLEHLHHLHHLLELQSSLAPTSSSSIISILYIMLTLFQPRHLWQCSFLLNLGHLLPNATKSLSFMPPPWTLNRYYHYCWTAASTDTMSLSYVVPTILYFISALFAKYTRYAITLDT